MTQLSENIRLLGDLLGQIIVEQAGQEVFELEERIRALSKAWRAGDESANREIGKIIQEVADDLPLTSDILKAFSTYFQLVNLAEEHERIRILHDRAEQAFADQVAMRETIPAAIEVLKRESFDADQVEAMLENMLIMPVFTAHPTESRRRTTRLILGHLSEFLSELRSGGTYQYQHPNIIEKLRDAITLLWQSDESRKRKPTVLDEVRNSGLYFFENTLFDVIPQIYEQLESALREHYPGRDWNVPPILRYGSWIGGDRDGNPFVTNETTESTIRTHKELVLERYAADVQSLYELLSPARGRAGFNEQFLKQLDTEISALPEFELDVIERFHQEPYRQKLILIYRRLMATIELNKQDWKDAEPNSRAFETPSALLEELREIDRSLRENRGAGLADGQLSRLIRRVQVFGFHLASLDIRQHSEQHAAALAEVLQAVDIAPRYEKMPEEEKVELLARETANNRPLTAQLNFSEDCNDTISLFRLIKQAQINAGPESIQSYVVSMTESVSDVLEVLLLMSDAGLFGQLDLVPLFETVDDLRAAPEIMTQLFENEVYIKHLALRGNRQQIMIGYSDSNKDGGFLRANWMLFTAQRHLAATCSDHDICLTLFHGRGGSIGRGGGPANRAILAQPNESIRGRIRVTEQGEVVSSRYTHPEIATRHLQQLVHAVICSNGHRPEYSGIKRWSEIMDQLSTDAFEKYRQLVKRPEFVNYFQTATPIEHIDRLNLGSRPARRKKTQVIGDLRAIPWVFAWTQSRTNIPSWFGVGTACHQWIESDNSEQRLEELREMYRNWPFFQTLMNNVHVGLGRADLNISELYSQLVREDLGANIFSEIRNEYELTRSHVLQITGHEEILGTEKWLQHSIRVRNPYVDPMNYIQIALLKRYRRSEDEAVKAQMQEVILQSVNGIAAGLQSVG